MCYRLRPSYAGIQSPRSIECNMVLTFFGFTILFLAMIGVLMMGRWATLALCTLVSDLAISLLGRGQPGSFCPDQRITRLLLDGVDSVDPIHHPREANVGRSLVHLSFCKSPLVLSSERG